LVKSYKST